MKVHRPNPCAVLRQGAAWGLYGCLLVAGTAQAQALKPGLWEFEGRHSRLSWAAGPALDMQKINQQLQAQMVDMEPGLRRVLEENLRSAGVVMTQGRSQRLCVSSDQANLVRIAEQHQQESCRFTLLESGAGFVRGQLQCAEPQGQGSYVTTLDSPEKLSTRVELKTPQGQLVVTSGAKWLGADCADTPSLGKQRLHERSLFNKEK